MTYKMLPRLGGSLNLLSFLGKVARGLARRKGFAPHTDPERSERGVYLERKSIMEAIR